MITPKQHLVEHVEVLDLPAGHPLSYGMTVDGRSLWVRDFGTSRFESGSPGTGEIRVVCATMGMAISCTCPDKQYRGGTCRHMAGVNKVSSQW